jgi:hypothetical protein
VTSHQLDDLPPGLGVTLDVSLGDGQGRMSRQSLNVTKGTTNSGDLLGGVGDEGSAT